MVIYKFNEDYDRRYRKGFDKNYSEVMSGYIQSSMKSNAWPRKSKNRKSEDINDPSFQGTNES